jgi:NAD(P)-dependent dehydrogenase (short-subunit alcohol dehydrogenase family)
VATVVITGANRGLGRACTEEFATAGWTVLAVAKTEPPDDWASSGSGAIRWVHQDLRDPVGPELLHAVGGDPVAVLINNAARGAPPETVLTVEARSLVEAVDVNVAGPLRLVQALLPNLLAAPDPIVVNVSSRLGAISAQSRGEFASLSTSYAYRVSKAAQNMLTIALAHELAGRVRCWAVHPGVLATGMGQPGATKPPRLAARELRELVASPDRTSPRFCSLGGPDLSW